MDPIDRATERTNDLRWWVRSDLFHDRGRKRDLHAILVDIIVGILDETIGLHDEAIDDAEKALHAIDFGISIRDPAI